MSHTYSAKLIYGIRFERKKEKIKVTRFHEKTGISYEKEVINCSYCHINENNKFIFDCLSYKFYAYSIYEFCSDNNLEYFYDGYECDGALYIGYPILEVDEFNSEEVKEDLILSKDEKRNFLLSKIPNSNIKFYLICS